MREIMDEGKILLVNLSKGRTGDLNSKLLGMIFVMKFQAAAMSRADIPEDERKDFCLYVDEFQNFATDSFESILSEARKFKLNLIVANQFITQLEEGVRDAIFGNIGAVVSHRVGTNDAEQLEKYFRPIFDVDDLQQLPNYNAIVKMLIGGVPTQPFSMADLPYLGHANNNLADALKQLSAAKNGRPRAVVEKEIFDRLTVIPQPKPAFGGMGPNSGAQQSTFGAGLPAGAKPKSAGQSSFLDEWLAKRKQQPVKASSSNEAPKQASTTSSIPSTPQEPITTNQSAEDQIKYNPEPTKNKNIDNDALAKSIAELQVPPGGVDVIQNEDSAETEKDYQNIAKTGDNGHLKHEDTIIIDRDGNLKTAK